MVANRRPRAHFVLAPGGIVAVAELLSGAIGVDIVAEREDGSVYFAQSLAVLRSWLKSHPAMSPAPTSVTVRALEAPGVAVSTATMDASIIAAAIELITTTVLLISFILPSMG